MADTTPRILDNPVDFLLFEALPLERQAQLVAHLAALAADGSEPATADQLTALAACLRAQVPAWTKERTLGWLQDHWRKSGLRALTRREAAAATWRLSRPAGTAPADAEFATLTPVLTPASPVTAAQVAALGELRQAAAMTEAALARMCQNLWRKDDPRHLNQEQYQAAWGQLRRKLAPALAAAWQETAP